MSILMVVCVCVCVMARKMIGNVWHVWDFKLQLLSMLLRRFSFVCCFCFFFHMWFIIVLSRITVCLQLNSS